MLAGEIASVSDETIPVKLKFLRRTSRRKGDMHAGTPFTCTNNDVQLSSQHWWLAAAAAEKHDLMRHEY